MVDAQLVIETGDTRDNDLLGVEDFLAARDRATMLVDPVEFVLIPAPDIADVHAPEQFVGRHGCAVTVVVSGAGVEPRLEDIENRRGERRPLRIAAERIVDADEELLRCQCNRPRGRVVVGQEFGFVVEQLGGEYALLEFDDLIDLLRCRRHGRLCVTESGVDRLIPEAGIEIDIRRRFAAIPHDGAVESDIRRRQWAPVHRENADGLACRLLGDAGVRTCVAAIGSLTAVTVNSAVAGIASPMRINPFSVSSLYALRLARSVETSSLGQVAPSTSLKMGSVPLLLSNRSATSRALTDQPFCG